MGTISGYMKGTPLDGRGSGETRAHWRDRKVYRGVDCPDCTVHPPRDPGGDRRTSQGAGPWKRGQADASVLPQPDGRAPASRRGL